MGSFSCIFSNNRYKSSNTLYEFLLYIFVIMNRQYRRNNISNTFKDYFVPIVGFVLIVIILYSFFSGGDEVTSIDTENRTGYALNFDGLGTEAFIEYETGKRETVENQAEIFKWEKLIVKEGSVDISIDGITQIKVDKLWELKFNSDGSYSLFSSDAWFSSSSPTNINLRYGTVKTSWRSIISLSQNEVGSTVYVISGTVEVANLWGQTTLLWKSQKITIPVSDASKEDIDLSLLKSELDNFFLGSDWFLENNGPALLQQSQENQETGTGSTDSGSWLIGFSGLRDEMRVDSSTLDVRGVINDDTVAKVSINNTDVRINETDNTFALEEIPLSGSINDLVVKVFNINGTILEKNVYTVYTSSVSEVPTSNTSSTTPIGTSSSSGWSTLYSADATQFGFTAPSSDGKFSTTGSEITIRGITTAEGISKVEVNGFELGSFNGSTWRYHAFSRFETLLPGTNQYKIDYYGPDDTIVYTDYYTIVKRDAGAVPVDTVNTPTVPEEETISDEVNPQ